MPPSQPVGHRMDSKIDDNCLLPLYLDGILMQALLQNPTDRDFILSAEAQLLNDLAAKEMIEFPQLNSYYRMMLHRVARYYSMNHFYSSSKEKEKIILEAKDSGTKKPVFLLRELVEPEILAEEEKKNDKTKKAKEHEKRFEEEAVSNAATKKFKIIKRPAQTDRENSKSKESQLEKPQKSVQEKEAEYERARSRLFADLPSDEEVENHYPEENEDYYYKEGKEGEGDYFNYQYHVPYYPSYYFQQHQHPAVTPQVQQQLQPKALNMTKPKMMYSTDLREVPVPRHILILSIGKLNSLLLEKHNIKTKRYRDPMDDDEVTLVIFPSVELALNALKNGLGNKNDL
jgi:hypothetical protein